MLENNKNYLSKNFSWILDVLNTSDKFDHCAEYEVEIKPGKLPTICTSIENKKVYLHSKYNPLEEAKRIIDHLENIDSYDYVVFFGFGLGYQVEYFADKYPKKPFSVYEPKLEIFKLCLETSDISFLDNCSIDNFYLPGNALFSDKKLESFINNFDGSILFIPLASYEAAFPDEYASFNRLFGQYTSNTEILDNTKRHNDKLHTINVLRNFEYIMNTPNIVKQDNASFRNKPAVLVAAGPSLEYELENLKYIKENGLAYIFSAASAISTLLDNGILPDACWSMDPNDHSTIVYEKMLKMGVNSVPLVFGTTTGAKLIDSYPGNLYHFVTSKDLVTPYYFSNEIDTGDIVDTASSIAVVALLALHKLGLSPIILVGQNLAYKDNRYYAKGINHGLGSEMLHDKYFYDLYKVPGVDGDYVYTDDSLNCFRKDMENYIRKFDINNVTNTTRHGASIKGTVYITLDELIRDKLKEKVVDPFWEEKLQDLYDLKQAKMQSGTVHREISSFRELAERLTKLWTKVHSSGGEYIPAKHFAEFILIFDKLMINSFFHVFLYSMNTYECKLLIRHVRSANISNASEAPVSWLDRFMDFVNTCMKDADKVTALIDELKYSIPDCLVFTVLFRDK